MPSLNSAGTLQVLQTKRQHMQFVFTKKHNLSICLTNVSHTVIGDFTRFSVRGLPIIQ